MVTTRRLSESIREDLNSAEFRRALLGETINCMAGDVETGKIALREYINGTIGFVGLGKALEQFPDGIESTEADSLRE